MAKNIMKFNEERTFGVEIEFAKIDDDCEYVSSYMERINNFCYGTIQKEIIASALKAAGLNAESERYNHNTRPYWKVITDGSCGLEVVSPILKGKNGLEQIKRVCEVLNTLGANVNKNCGLHVHHYVGDLDERARKNIAAIYLKYEDAIDSIMPTSRRGSENYYCKGYQHIDKVKAIKDLNDKKDSTDCYSKMEDINRFTRYRKLNVESFRKYGTYEFRHHAGTTNGEKITNWVLFTQAIINKAETSKRAISPTSKVVYDEIGYCLAFLGCLKQADCSTEMMEMKRYMMKRLREFKKKEEDLRALQNTQVNCGNMYSNPICC